MWSKAVEGSEFDLGDRFEGRPIFVFAKPREKTRLLTY